MRAQVLIGGLMVLGTIAAIVGVGMEQNRPGNLATKIKADIAADESEPYGFAALSEKNADYAKIAIAYTTDEEERKINISCISSALAKRFEVFAAEYSPLASVEVREQAFRRLETGIAAVYAGMGRIIVLEKKFEKLEEPGE